MRKICINNRDELVMLFVDNIAYIMADGNCTKIKYIGGLQTTLSLGISKVEAMLSDSWRQGGVCPFVRLGRSLIVNQMFLYEDIQGNDSRCGCKERNKTENLTKSI